MDFIRSVENFVFGAECLGCGRASESLDPWLCPDCVGELERASKVSLFPGPDVYSLYPMRPITRRLVHALKYKSVPGMATYLVQHSSARKNGAVGSELSLLPKPLYFVPVPLVATTKQKKLRRHLRYVSAGVFANGCAVRPLLSRRQSCQKKLENAM